MSCRYSPDLGYRVLTRGDQDEPCPDRHCVVCWRGHCDDTNPQTCPECVGVVREHLTEIVAMADRLEDEAVHTHADGRLHTGPLGGDAMVMLAEGRYLPASRVGPDQLRNDPVPPLLVLATWEDDWRVELGHGGGPRATLWRCADYLGTHLTMMAQRHCAFDEFASDLARLRGRMEAVLHDGDQPETGAPCMTLDDRGRECTTPLVKHYGRTVAQDHWRCPRCRTRYSANQYLFVVQQDYRKHADAMPAEHIEAEFGVTPGTLRVWATRGKVARRGCDSVGRQLYDVRDVRRHADGEDVA
jgi:hypothetical protein